MLTTLPDQHGIPAELGPPADELVGGFAADTTIVTPAGLVRVQNLDPGDPVYAFNPQTRLVKHKPVSTVASQSFDGQLIEVSTRRATLLVHPDHPVLFRIDANPRPRFMAAGDLTDRCEFRFINRWRRPPRPRLESFDLSELLEEYQICASTDLHGHTFRARLPEGCEPVQQNQWVGYVFDAATFQAHRETIEGLAEEVSIRTATGHHRRPFVFDGNDFIELLGWYVTEGDVYRKSGKSTAEVKLAQECPDRRAAIRRLLSRMGIPFNDSGRAVRFGSELYGRIFERLAGTESREKRLPLVVWDLSYQQQALLMETLLRGDGNERGTYYTASATLAEQVCRLCVDLGMKPRHAKRGNVWSVYVKWVNDGFTSAAHVRPRPYTGEVFQLGVVDYPAVMAGRDRKFQWTGTCQVS